MNSDPANLGFSPCSSPIKEGIRELHMFDFPESDISVRGGAYLPESQHLDSEWLGPLSFSPSDQSIDTVADMKDATDLEFSDRVMEIDEDSDDDNYPEKHAITPPLMAVTDFAELTEFALLGDEIARIDLGEPILECPHPFDFITTFQPAPVPEPHWFNGDGIQKDFGANLPIPYQGETNPYTNVQYPIQEPYNHIVGHANGLQPFLPEHVFRQDQRADLIYQQQQQQQRQALLNPAHYVSLLRDGNGANVSPDPMMTQNFNYITAKNVTINVFPGRQQEAQ